MQNLRPEMGQFGRLVESEPADGCRPVHHARIVVVQPVDVGPYLDFGGAQCGTDQRGAVIAASPSQVVDLPRSISADIPLCNEQTGKGIFVQRLAHVAPDKTHVRFPVPVRPHEIGGRQQGGVHPLFLQVEIHQPRDDQFALGQHHFLRGGGERLAGDPPQQGERFGYMRFRLGPASLRPVKTVGDIRIPPFEFCDGGQGSGDIVTGELPGDRRQRVRRPGHGRKHDHLGFFAANQPGDVLDSFDGTYRGPAEFQYFHLFDFHSLFPMRNSPVSPPGGKDRLRSGNFVSDRTSKAGPTRTGNGQRTDRQHHEKKTTDSVSFHSDKAVLSE